MITVPSSVWSSSTANQSCWPGTVDGGASSFSSASGSGGAIGAAEPGSLSISMTRVASVESVGTHHSTLGSSRIMLNDGRWEAAISRRAADISRAVWKRRSGLGWRARVNHSSSSVGSSGAKKLTGVNSPCINRNHQGSRLSPRP